MHRRLINYLYPPTRAHHIMNYFIYTYIMVSLLASTNKKRLGSIARDKVGIDLRRILVTRGCGLSYYYPSSYFIRNNVLLECAPHINQLSIFSYLLTRTHHCKTQLVISHHSIDQRLCMNIDLSCIEISSSTTYYFLYYHLYYKHVG